MGVPLPTMCLFRVFQLRDPHTPHFRHRQWEPIAQQSPQFAKSMCSLGPGFLMTPLGLVSAHGGSSQRFYDPSLPRCRHRLPFKVFGEILLPCARLHADAEASVTMLGKTHTTLSRRYVATRFPLFIVFVFCSETVLTSICHPSTHESS